MDGMVAVTYRCNSRCIMCHTWAHQSAPEDEIRPEHLLTLPKLVRLNITGGEPFLRDDLSDILDVAKTRAKRVVISTNGFLTRKTLKVMEKHKDVGIRISVDGIGETHNRIRGFRRAHEASFETLRGLKELGVKDLGIAVTASDQNAGELVAVYDVARRHGVELATAILHNAYYFHIDDNEITDKARVEAGLQSLVKAFLRSPSPKDWFRAYFTKGFIDQMYGRPRELKCTMVTDSFFIDPYGDIRPCNVIDYVFGNIKETPFDVIWNSDKAREARMMVDRCAVNCWMIGSVGHLIRRKFWIPLSWIAQHKFFARNVS
ncbi:MAG: Antilisterial bacteriocin subtilosin biosynthesis protein AlbA [Syntrophorhabdaceae bacterium PtaU1.Bin034]|nr:MAG: Antilisterial bacteriocin subtilosin biosynthesis protein AlbA [Syntrophorhabdaceae bacterium PtaU1.Bin034]